MRGTGLYQIAQRFEVMVRVIIGQVLACIGLAAERSAIRDSAGSIGGTVGAVRSGAENYGFGQARDIQCRGKHKLLVAPSQPVPVQRDSRFTARDYAGRWP